MNLNRVSVDQAVLSLVPEEVSRIFLEAAAFTSGQRIYPECTGSDEP